MWIWYAKQGHLRDTAKGENPKFIGEKDKIYVYKWYEL